MAVRARRAGTGDDAFGPGYRVLYAHRSRGAAQREVDGLLAWLGSEVFAGPVLDAGCGFGRHTEALLARGVRAVGLDRSMEQLRGAGASRGNLALGDLLAPPIRPGSLAGVLCLFQVFGLQAPEEDQLMLGRLHRLLAPGGFLVIDLLDPDRVRQTLVRRERVSRAGWSFAVARRIRGARVQKRVMAAPPPAVAGSGWREDVALYEPEQLAGWLAQAGFCDLAWAGELDGRARSPATTRLVVRARRDGA